MAKKLMRRFQEDPRARKPPWRKFSAALRACHPTRKWWPRPRVVEWVPLPALPEDLQQFAKLRALIYAASQLPLEYLRDTARP